VAGVTQSPFQQYFSWLFNFDQKSEIPKDLLKSTSPISNTYAISTFLNCGPLNNYLDQYFNNVGIWYLEKKDLFLFLKKCVKDFKVNRKSIVYIPWKKTTKMYDVLRNKFPELKAFEISFICDMIDKSEDKDEILATFGLDEVSKKKITKKERKEMQEKEVKNEDAITVEEFLKQNFEIDNEEENVDEN
jgi:hypothetical protein